MIRFCVLALMFSLTMAFVSGQNLVVNNPDKERDKVEKQETKGSDEYQVREVIDRFFLGMLKSDSSMISSCLINHDLLLSRTFFDREGIPTYSKGTIGPFLQSVASQPAGRLREEISNVKIDIRDNLASTWMDFHFYLDGKLSHCGVNSFQFSKTQSGWKIIHLADTRQTEGCADFEMDVHTLLDSWHVAAAGGDLEAYFGMMGDQFIFLGTDASERWNKEEFRKFCEPVFRDGTGWDFKKVKRHLYFDDALQFAWFEEELDTWMGPCRGSGVIRMEKNGWRIMHYNLAILVPNEKVQDYLQLLDKG